MMTNPKHQNHSPFRAWLYLVPMLVLIACSRESTSPQPYALGETAEVDGWKITVHSLSPVAGDEWHQPAAGHIFVAVELTLENTSGRIRYMMPEKQMYLLDAAGHVISTGRQAGVMVARSRQWYVPQGEVEAGEVLHGAAAYEIPVDSQGLRWTCRSGLLPWSKSVVFVLGEVSPQ
jgi:hypothetical protein